ncbi:MAG: 3-oxoacyl-ACP synthase [Flavobacteriaceae bacterium]|nr:3-oxoacyl-ACP synthase [Flavobacteriaceae bacterium]|tara:strand:+ start:372387 stop:372839 length:453 start_codon:yes stop_codon:yes gene_type:complete
MQELKEAFCKQCLHIVEVKLQNTLSRIQSLQNDLNSETKSSAGDKHETGRAMIQLEMEKESQKLNDLQEMKNTLIRIDTNTSNEIVKLGSLVSTSMATYFISASLGALKTENGSCFAISPKSPIGSMLLGKKTGDELVFNGRKIEINSIT